MIRGGGREGGKEGLSRSKKWILRSKCLSARVRSSADRPALLEAVSSHDEFIQKKKKCGAATKLGRIRVWLFPFLLFSSFLG